jgi:eukaryotic-like serine/threonine-protein kinase
MNIDPKDWRTLSGLLDVALDLNDAERDAWLSRLSAEGAPLLEPLRHLLAQRARFATNDFLKAPPDFAGALLSERNRNQTPIAELEPGAAVGAYRLIRELGRGGMGAVWLAERSDGKLKRKVALKFPYAGPRQRQLAERLQRERDILASLEHSHIARIYDADVTASGQPFLALEYVDGIPVHEYCDAQRLTVRQRLQLFGQVFSAVQYAHTRLVIHRDLKPSNVLVSADGNAHLLDFGIAKLIAEGANEDSPLTAFGGRALTPDYASPEQIAGSALTTTSDIYSLGVVLYELLAGARPYRLKRDSQASLEEAIALADVEAPSRAVEGEAAANRSVNARQLVRELRGDIDTIVLKSLQKQPDQRYVSVDAFAQDVARFLDGRPVSARPESAWYRARKMVARNRVAVGAGFAIVLALGAGLLIALLQLRVARAERQRAEDSKEFIASIFRAADPFFTGNQSMSAADLLALARQRVDRELSAQPAMAVELLAIVGESQVNLEQLDAARATLEKAIKIGAASLAPDDVSLAEARARLAYLETNERDFDAAKPLFAQAIPELRRAGKRGSRVLSESLQMRGFIEMFEGNPEAAIADAKEAVAISTAGLGAMNSETILSKRALAQIYLQSGHVTEATAAAEEAYHDARAIYPAGERNGLMVDTEDLYGRVLAEGDRLDEGIEHLRHAIGDAALLYGAKNESVSGKLSFLARAQSRAGDMQGMIESAQRYLDAVANDVDRTQAQVSVSGTLLLARQPVRAAELVAPAIKSLEQSDASGGSMLARARAAYGSALAQLGRSDEAEHILQGNLKSLEGSKGIEVALTYNALGLAQRLAGKAAESEQSHRKALEFLNDSVLQARWKAEALTGAGFAQLDSGHPGDAQATLQQADTAAHLYFRGMAPARADVLQGLGRAALDQGQTAEAVRLLAQADDYWRGYDPDNRSAGEAAYWHGRALSADDQPARARESLARAAKILEVSVLAVDSAMARDAKARMAGNAPRR